MDASKYGNGGEEGKGEHVPQPHYSPPAPRSAPGSVDAAMTHHKLTLPQKTCQSCNRPFTWRRKWARDWDQVRYCSDRCRAAGPPA